MRAIVLDRQCGYDPGGAVQTSNHHQHTLTRKAVSLSCIVFENEVFRLLSFTQHKLYAGQKREPEELDERGKLNEIFNKNLEVGD
jgi:predicted nucleotidyltransferase